MQFDMARFAFRLRFPRYVLSSSLALGADVAAFVLLLQMRVAAVLASVVAYALGLAIHWLISTRFVFAPELAAEGPRRMRQRLLFIASALAGLTVTAATIQWAVQLKWDPGLSKALAVAISFQVTYLLRRKVVFP